MAPSPLTIQEEVSKMPQNNTPNSQTLVINVADFGYRTEEHANGFATRVRFKIDNPRVSPGDVLLILSGSDLVCHGLIGGIENGYGVATDRSGSQLPAIEPPNQREEFAAEIDSDELVN